MTDKVHLGHRARKRFGQNFLFDEMIIDKIVSAIDPKPEDNLVEIGPGLGAITEPVAELSGHLTVVELDKDLAKRLIEHPFLGPKLTVNQGDAMKYDFASLVKPDKKLKVFGNLPYNISTPLLFHLFEFADNIEHMHFMLQKEVVNRIVARHGSKTYGRLSVMIQAFFEVESMFTVPKESFDPQPKIESAILYLKAKTKPLTKNTKLLEKIVKISFSQRRKTLKNCLKSILSQEQTKIDLSQRAEMLSVENFITLMKDYEKQN
jgi:16S rRNA (adenine1518-N6/adenine1519-N6)-dimethyltransferase